MQNKGMTINFEGQNIFVGIDTHLKNWSVTIMLEHSEFKTFSQNPSARDLANYLKKNFPGGNYYSGYEASFCGYSIHRELEANGIHNFILNPADIPTTDKERKQKEDRRDSRKIAHALRKGDARGIYIPSPDSIDFRCLVRYRATVVKEIARNKNRIKSILYFHGVSIPPELDGPSKHWSGKFTNWLKEITFDAPYSKELINHTVEITEQLRSKLLMLNKNFREMYKNSPKSGKLKLLTGIPGIGLVTAATLLSEIEDINRFGNLDQLCSFVGLIPTTNSTGEKERVGSITPRANNPLRKNLIESAWTAVKHDPSLALAFNILCQRMNKNRAIVRIAKKLLGRIKNVLKNEKEYVLCMA